MTDTKAFKKWFKGSLVVDDAGEPLMVYHGTGSKFDTFEMNDGAMGRGVYFSSVFEEAADYAAEALGEELSEENDMGGDWVGTYIKEAYLCIKDPGQITHSKYGSGESIYLATDLSQIWLVGQSGPQGTGKTAKVASKTKELHLHPIPGSNSKETYQGIPLKFILDVLPAMRTYWWARGQAAGETEAGFADMEAYWSWNGVDKVSETMDNHFEHVAADAAKEGVDGDFLYATAEAYAAEASHQLPVLDEVEKTASLATGTRGSVFTGTTPVVYHGSQDPELRFSENRAAYFTNDKKLAESFATRTYMGEGLLPGEVPTVYSARLSFANALVLTTDEEYERMMQDTDIDVTGLQAKGYDGLVYKPEGLAAYYAVFSPDQIEDLKAMPVTAGKMPVVAKKKYTREEAVEYLTDSKNLAKYIKQTGITGMLSTLSAEEFQEAVIEALTDMSMGDGSFSEQVDQLIEEDAEEVNASDFPDLFSRILDIYVFDSDQFDDLYNIPAEFDIWRNITVDADDVDAAVQSLKDTGKVGDYKGVGAYWAADEKHAIAHWGSGGTELILHGKVPAEAIDWKHTVYARIRNYDEMELYIPEGTAIQLIEILTPDGPVAVNKQVTAAPKKPSKQKDDINSFTAGSIVIDDMGNPRPVYHGTHADFDQFRIDGLGAHFGTEDQAQDRLNDTAGDEADARIMEVYLSLKNPYNIVSDLGDWEDMGMLEEYLAEANEGPFTDEEFAQFKTPADVRKGLQAKGYDGLVYENEFEGDTGESYIVFDPSQIKIIK